MRDEYSISGARANLFAIVQRVRAGHSIVITVHGEPAAELRPINRPVRRQSIAERIAELERRGELSPAKRAPGAPLTLKRVARRRGALKRFLQDRA